MERPFSVTGKHEGFSLHHAEGGGCYSLHFLAEGRRPDFLFGFPAIFLILAGLGSPGTSAGDRQPAGHGFRIRAGPHGVEICLAPAQLPC